MNDTGFLHLTNTSIQIALFAVAAFMAALMVRQFARYGMAAGDAKTLADAPGFPMMGIFTKGLFLVIFLMAAFTINTWLPKAPVKAPAVNSTMQQQIYRDAEREVDITPVIEADPTDAEGRASRVEEIREGFKALPDAE
jgi:hypothetical protein